MSPSGVHALVEQGHTVLVEKDAGLGSFFEDKDYKDAGADIVSEQSSVWDVEMVIKVKNHWKKSINISKKDSSYLHTYILLMKKN